MNIEAVNPLKRKVYLETSVISYLTARPSKTIIGAAHQQITSAWWNKRYNMELQAHSKSRVAKKDHGLSR